MTRATPADRLAASESRIREACERAASTRELVDGLGVALRRALDVQGMFLGATDPESTVFATAAVIENLPESMCAPWMHNEFMVDDFNKFAELHRDKLPATTLHRVTQGRLSLSPRHAQLNGPLGFGDELRTTFSRGDACWGVANLLRAADGPAFDDGEIRWLESLRPMIAAAFQRTIISASPAGVDDAIPGVITLDPDGEVLSMSQSAGELLAELTMNRIDAGQHSRLPGQAYMIVTLARARARGMHEAVRPVTRVQGASGRWLTLRGDYTLSHSGELANVVLVIEPSRPTEIMPLVVASYGLTAREQEVLTELTSGRASGEIAARLFISEHTVRDHVKSILSKTGTCSRGELMSQLFHHHAFPVTEFVHR
ncbi:helix-turn-helix transcriptional regulator [Lolliginicoccus suaedae]|uniref:helix-turn-helix transcriptional regulator n=1 Tax=Lolliginicoccus suaedae TaxID=2605429 RepID=UPI0011F05144|nr:LuxR C-terminal-related transcriptional regulator [Lolliginicoccus suaedae]